MKKTTINIDGIDVEVGTSAGLCIDYREEFNEDLLVQMGGLLAYAKEHGSIPMGQVMVIFQLVYAMAKHVNADILPYKEWLKQFSIDGILNNLDGILKLWSEDQETTAKEKKDNEQ